MISIYVVSMFIGLVLEEKIIVLVWIETQNNRISFLKKKPIRKYRKASALQLLWFIISKISPESIFS